MPHKYNKNYFQYTGRSRPILLLFEIAEEEHNRKSDPEEWKATKIEGKRLFDYSFQTYGN